MLRIEDTDRKRFVPEALQDIYDTFEWLGFHWDEGPDVGGPYGPYFQSERLPIYQEYAEELLAGGHGLPLLLHRGAPGGSAQGAGGRGPAIRRRRATTGTAGTLSEAERGAAEAAGTPSVIRLAIPLEGSTSYTDLLLGDITVENTDDQPGPGADQDRRVPHVPPGQSWWTITSWRSPTSCAPRSGCPRRPLHVILYDAFGWEPPVFCHLPMVMGKDGHKLSKRQGSTSVREFRAQGYLPEALLNCIALVGWSYDGAARAVHAEGAGGALRHGAS